MKIICVDNAFATNASEPSIYLLPGTSILNRSKPFYKPEYAEHLSASVGFVLRLSKVGKYVQPEFAYKYVDAVAVAIRFQSETLMQFYRENNMPIDMARAFDLSFPLSKFTLITEQQPLESMKLTLEHNQSNVFHIAYKNVAIKLETLIPHLSKFFIIRIGDYVFMDAGIAIDPVALEDLFILKLNDAGQLKLKVK